MEAESSQGRVKLLSFEVADRRCAVPLSDVREVLRAVAVTRLPQSPPVVEGVVSLRGALVPVMDVRWRMGLPAKPVELEDRLIVAEAAERVIALRVDRVGWIREVDDRAIHGTRDLAPDAAFVEGIATLPDGLVLIYDLHRFLSSAEQVELARALGTHEATRDGR